MSNKYLVLFSISSSLFLFSCGGNSHDQKNDYPEGSEVAHFKEIELLSESLELISEIDIFAGSTIPVGQIVAMEEIGDNLYFAEFKQNLVHVVDKESLKYKTSIGGPGPDQLFRVFGLYATEEDNLLVGNAQGPYLLKSFSSNGDFLMNYSNNDPPFWFISTDVNNSFISDSIAYVTKAIADNGMKMIRYDLRGGSVTEIDEIVPVVDLHAELDSAALATVIPQMSVLKSNVNDSMFYVLPANKYLINSYNMKGEKLSSIDLRGIPQINRQYTIIKKLLFNSYFYSAVIDDQDNIYFHFHEFEGVDINDSEAEIMAEIASKTEKLNLVSVNLLDGSYRMFKTEFRSVKPLKIIDGKLWTFDPSTSTLVLYQLPYN